MNRRWNYWLVWCFWNRKRCYVHGSSLDNDMTIECDLLAFNSRPAQPTKKVKFRLQKLWRTWGSDHPCRSGNDSIVGGKFRDLDLHWVFKYDVRTSQKKKKYTKHAISKNFLLCEALVADLENGLLKIPL